MSLIEGIGDEVTEFFLITAVICIGWVAWFSTAINNRLRVRTVLIFEHRSNRVEAPPQPPVDDTVQPTPEETIEAMDDGATPSEDTIHIKLKYLNDEIKQVQAHKTETLAQFKRRTIRVENNKIVRLIFNGQVLDQSNNTLEDCGLFDNCVVHCLIHQRPTPTTTPTATAPATETTNRNESILPWDLGNVLLVLISLVLCGAWYFRFEYAQLFTVTATVFLMCLTGIFTLLLIGILYPDPTPAPTTTQ